MAVTWSSSAGDALRPVLSVLWMTESDVYECLVMSCDHVTVCHLAFLKVFPFVAIRLISFFLEEYIYLVDIILVSKIH